MPLREEEVKNRRNIINLYQSGMTVRQVAEATRSTKGHVRRTLSGNQ
jgi:hypothetical protein